MRSSGLKEPFSPKAGAAAPVSSSLVLEELSEVAPAGSVAEAMLGRVMSMMGGCGRKGDAEAQGRMGAPKTVLDAEKNAVKKEDEVDDRMLKIYEGG